MKKLNQVLPGITKAFSTFLDWLIFLTAVSLFFTYLPITAGVREFLLEGTRDLELVHGFVLFWVDEWLLHSPSHILCAIVLRKILNHVTRKVHYAVTLDADRSRKPSPSKANKKVWVFASDERLIRWSRQITDSSTLVGGKLKSCLGWGLGGFVLLCMALPALFAYAAQESMEWVEILAFWNLEILGKDLDSFSRYTLDYLLAYNARMQAMFSTFDSFYLGAWLIQLLDLLFQRLQLRGVNRKVKNTLSPATYSQLCAASPKDAGAGSPKQNPPKPQQSSPQPQLPFPVDSTQKLCDNLKALEQECKKGDYSKPYDVIWISSLDHSQQLLKYIPGTGSFKLPLTTAPNDDMTLKFTHHSTDGQLHLVLPDGQELPLPAYEPKEMTLTGNSPDFYMTRFPHRSQKQSHWAWPFGKQEAAK